MKMTPIQVAATLGISAERVRRLIRSQALPAMNVSPSSKQRRWIVDSADLQRFGNGRMNIRPARRRGKRRAQASADALDAGKALLKKG